MSRAHGRAERAADAPSLLGIVPDDLDAEADLLLRIGDRLALLAGQQFRDGGDALLDEIGGAMQDPGTFVGMHLRPSGKGALGGRDRGVDVRAVRQGRRADGLAGRRIVDFERAPSRAARHGRR